MPKKYSLKYHVVYSPKDKEDVNNKKDLLSKYLKKECEEYILSQEVGEKKTNLHLDMIIVLKSTRRVDKVRESFQRLLDDYGKYSIKVYAIDDERYEWQIGYCLKEGDMLESCSSADFEYCKEKYFSEEKKYANSKIDKAYNIDELVADYVNWLLESKLNHNSDNWRTFKIRNRDKIKYSTLCKIKLDVLMEYCEMYEIYEYKNI